MMKVPFLDLKRENDLIHNELDDAITRVLRRGHYILGEEVKTFENEFAEYLNVENCISCANGTDALELALQVLEIGKEDEVIVPALGWLSAALAVKKAGAVPVFVDVQLDTANIDPVEVRKAITDKTRAIVGIHLFGLPCDVNQLSQICKQRNLFFIEDCSQAHGAEVDGIKVGNFGDIATFSFYPTKNLGCLGDGGALATNSNILTEKLLALRSYGKIEGQFVWPGRNSRMDELQAAILTEKLKFLDGWNEFRRMVASSYNEKLEVFAYQQNSNTVFYRVHTLQESRENFISKSQSRGLQVGLSESTASGQPVFGYQRNMANAEQLASSLVALPLFIGITDKEIDFFIVQISKIAARQ